MNKFYLSALFCATAALSVSAADSWSTDLPTALKQAAEENKLVLVEFTGSDWCTGCIHLRRTVLEKPAFNGYVADKFVLVQVDLPLQVKKNHALYARNRAIADRYRVGGYPTLLVLTPEGKVAGGFEGPLPTDEVIAALNRARVSAKLLEKAQSQTGTARARTLRKVYKNFPDSKSFSAHREQLRAEIEAAQLK